MKGETGRRRAKGGWLVKKQAQFSFPPSNLTIARKIAENTAIDRASEARSIAVFSAILRAMVDPTLRFAQVLAQRLWKCEHVQT